MADSSTTTTATTTIASTNVAPRHVDVQVHFPVPSLVKALVTIGLFIVVAYAVQSLGAVLLQIMVASFMAIAVDRVVVRLEERGLPRAAAVGVVMFGIIVTLGVALLVFVPPLVDQAQDLAEHGPGYVQDILESDSFRDFDREYDVVERSTKFVESSLADMPSRLGGTISLVVGSVFNGITFLFLFLFMLLGGGDLVRGAMRLSPQLSSPRAVSVIRGAYRNIGSYVAGALTIATIAGASLSLVLFILDVPFALPLGLWMLLLSLIPQIGATIGAIPAILVAFATVGPGAAIGVTVYVAIYQQLENVVLQPRIQGKMASLPGVVIFISVLVGGQLLGIVGALFAVPVASVAAILVRQYLEVTGRDDVDVESVALRE